MTAFMVLLMFLPCAVLIAILIGLIVLYIRMEKAEFDRLQHSFEEVIVSSDGTVSETPVPVSERIDPLPPEYEDNADADFVEEESDEEDLEEDPGEESEELPWD